MTMKHLNLRATKLQTVNVRKHSVPGLCPDLSHMITYVHSGNMAMVKCLKLASSGERKE